ncbi:MAG: FAD-dependent oxidoreductase [Acidimicrobiia bacterium]|nr:FAD-dependent oxidoreductase [Acidimicrobiia bacterium]
MHDSADVVVVGAGIVGSSIAYQIARRSRMKVVLLDKGAGPAEGSTGASSSICRCRYSNAQVVRLARDGLAAYRNWAEFTGLESPGNEFTHTGVLWLLNEDRGKLETERTRLADEGVAISLLTADELVERFPSLSPCIEPFDLSGEIEHTCRPIELAVFEDDAGFADPSAANTDLVEATRNNGGSVRFRAQVTGVRKKGDRVVGVDLADGSSIEADVVVNAAGPWCGRLNQLAGLDLLWPLEPTRVQVGYRDWPSDLGRVPVTVEASTGLYFRPDAAGSRILFGSVLEEDEQEVVEDPDNFNTGADAAFRDIRIHGLHHRIPDLPYRGGVSGIAGLYTINRTDVHPVVGPSGMDGYWLANGLSGHGFKLAPMIGSMVAQAITGERAPFDTDVPMSLLAVDREPISVAAKSVLA